MKNRYDLVKSHPKHQERDTRFAHAGAHVAGSSQTTAPIQPSIVQSSIFALGTSAEAEAIFSETAHGYVYSRFGNPTVDDLAKMIASIENGEEALITSSGNAAVLCTITAALEEPPGSLVTHHDVYGGSFELLRILSDIYRVLVEMVDSGDEPAWSDAVSRASAVLVETRSNPLMRLADLEKTVKWARIGGAPVIVDNTVATPFNQRPCDFGVDWVVGECSRCRALTVKESRKTAS